MPIICQKTSILSKHDALMSFFYLKNPCFHTQDRSKKVNSVKTTLLRSKKVNRIPLFSEFSRKNHCAQAHIWSKNVRSLKSKQLSYQYFVKKRPFSQKHGALMTSFS